MRILLKTLLVLVMLCTTCAPAQNTEASSPLSSLVSAEYAFARCSAEQGMDSAFVAFLSRDAIIFRPHPVNGQAWFDSHPASPVQLTWVPGFADVSITGEFGYTTGPWMARSQQDTTAPPSYGDFVSVWKRMEGGVWKVALDLGISHPAPASEVRFTVPEQTPRGPALIRPDSGFMATEKSRLLAYEREVFGDSLHLVPVERLRSTLGSGARILRPGRFPIVDADSIAAYFASHPGKFFRRTLGSDLSLAGDLGYTYGAYRSQGREAKDEMGGYYLTIWKKEDAGAWRIALDLQSAVE